MKRSLLHSAVLLFLEIAVLFVGVGGLGRTNLQDLPMKVFFGVIKLSVKDNVEIERGNNYSENTIEKKSIDAGETSSDGSLVQWFSSCNTVHRSALPMPSVAARLPCAWLAKPMRNTS